MKNCSNNSGHGQAHVQLIDKDFKSGDAATKIIIKARPETFDAVFLSGKHTIGNCTHTYGCVVKFPNGEVIYFKEEEFNKYFEIIEEED